MPRCFFNVANGVDVAIDHGGWDLASLDIAMREAIEDHLGLAIEALRQRKPLPVSYHIQICDGLGRPLAEVPFSAQRHSYRRGRSNSCREVATRAE